MGRSRVEETWSRDKNGSENPNPDEDWRVLTQNRDG